MNLNKQAVLAIIESYKENLHQINKEEIYKWEAIKCFQDNWGLDASDFTAMLKSSFAKAKNLLAAMNYFPKKMISIFSEKEPETVREMFSNLYDESLLLTDRIEVS